MNRRNFVFNSAMLTAGSVVAGESVFGKALIDIPENYTVSFVSVSSKSPGYFQLSNGEHYIPVGLNLCWAKDLGVMDSYFQKLSLNGGNYARVWLNFPQHEIETEFGTINSVNLSYVIKIVEMAVKYKIKVKFCIESFRRIATQKDFFTKSQYHKENGGPFLDMNEYINSEKGREVYLNRLQVFREKLGDHPAVFGWELWNEMNAINSEGVVEWNENMLPRVKAMFPKNLVLQSLGSFDSESARGVYRAINRLAANEVAQIHRYLDMGASLDICKAPMDLLASNSIEELRSYQIQKPMLLAEVGGVKPRHTGPIELYALDKQGILLHDLLFAPFFSGAAGPGHAWHWDSYVDKNDLWYHFKHFNETIKDVNPIEEQFLPIKIIGTRVRSYILVGRYTILAWCRDGDNDWHKELKENIPPAYVREFVLDLSSLLSNSEIRSVENYDPWNSKWSNLPAESLISMPPFLRSTVIIIKKVNKTATGKKKGQRNN